MPHADDEYKGQNYYALLGLQSDATEKKIRDAKKAKFILHTPDGGASPNASLLAMINHAADVLLKPAAREAYDVYWEREFASQPVEVVNPPPASPPPASVRPDVVFDDFFAGVELPEDLATRKSSMLYALLAWQRNAPPEKKQAFASAAQEILFQGKRVNFYPEQPAGILRDMFMWSQKVKTDLQDNDKYNRVCEQFYKQILVNCGLQQEPPDRSQRGRKM